MHPSDPNDLDASTPPDANASADAGHALSKPTRKRPAPGERRMQILQTLAQMLEQPGAERITTALLASKINVSEAALYRHFASKAQMFEGLIEFIESSVFGLINKINAGDAPPLDRAASIMLVVLQFAEKNPGMTRVMVGDALVFEHERLQTRMNGFFSKIEAQLRQVLREAAEAAGAQAPTVEAHTRAGLAVAFLSGRLHRFVRTGFRAEPTEHAQACVGVILR